MYNKVSKPKFRVRELLDALPKSDYDIAMRSLPDFLCVTRQTLSKIINVKEGEQYEPSFSTLLKLASVFNCTVEELITTKPEPVSIDQLRIISTGNTAKELSLSKM